MIRYLVDELKLDVNARDQPHHSQMPWYWGRPIDYVAFNGQSNSNCTWVVGFLLDRGADLEYAEAAARDHLMRNEECKLQHAVSSWKMRRDRGSEVETGPT